MSPADAAERLDFPTLQDWADLPREPGIKWELTDHGLVCSHAAHAPNHSTLISGLTRQVEDFWHSAETQSKPRWYFYQVVSLYHHQVERCYEPDLVGYRGRELDVAQTVAGNAITDMPDWVLEVVSKSSVSRDNIEKSRRYAQMGIQWYWIVDPRNGTVTCLTLDHETAQYELTTLPTPFDGIAFDFTPYFDD